MLFLFIPQHVDFMLDKQYTYPYNVSVKVGGFMSYGRREILTDAKQITSANVVEEVRKAATTHAASRTEIQTLYDYYCGKTKILTKKKEIREDINHMVNENRAFEIVQFHKGYVFGEPIQYVRREKSNENSNDDEIAADINALNGLLIDAGKIAGDGRLAEWMYIAGVGYRLVLPNKAWTADGDEAPFTIHTLDPRLTFIVRSNEVDRHPMMAVTIVERDQNEKVYGVYTNDAYYEFSEFDGSATAQPHTLGDIPIVEYPANAARLGVFEIVVSLIDAIDELQSNRMDDIVQYVNSFLAILGGELDEETYKRINEWKMLCLPEGTDAKYLSPAMSQSDVQRLKDDLYQAMLTICGIPNRNGGTSTSDTGQAVELRDGWSSAETRAKSVETEYKDADRAFLKLILRIMRDTVGTKLKLKDISAHFTRRNYENIATKSQVLVAMLSNPKIHPELAFASSGMFTDPESAYLQSMAYYEEQMEKWEPTEVDEGEEDNVQVS